MRLTVSPEAPPSSAKSTAILPAGLVRLPPVDWAAALRRAWARAHVRWLVGILIVALVLRLVWMFAVQPDPRDGRFDDSVWYASSARLLADGHGYVNYGELTPTALWAPGYPLVLAGLFRLPGDDIAAARALNVVAGLGMIAGVYYLGSRLWDKRAGLFAAAIMALFPSHIYFSTLVMTEVLFTASAVGVLCLALAWTLREDVSPRRVAVLGVATALLAMVRPEGSMFAVMIIAAWAAYHRSWRRVGMYAGLLVLGMSFVYVPWTVRNIIQLDAPVVSTNGLGSVLIQGHNPDAGGRPDLYAVITYSKQFDNLPQPEREVRMNTQATKDSIDYAVHHIPRELGLVPQRLAWFFRGDDTVVFWVNHGQPGEFSARWEDRWMGLANVYYYMVCGLMVLGLPFWLRRADRRHVLIFAPFAVYTAMWAFLFVGEARYHFPLLPIFALLGGIGLAAFLQRLSAWRAAPISKQS
jgi:4-amino-4-deoxy-L-arabinose transferase-like glycosyltransferase